MKKDLKQSESIALKLSKLFLFGNSVF
jgi:hypothetical protein